MKKNLYYIYIGVLMVFLAGCQDEGLFTSADDELAGVSYRVTVEDDLLSRSIGDATQVNNLTVVVFDKDNKKVLREDNLVWSDVQKDGLPLSLFKGTYRVLFWLQYADDNLKPYTIADNGQVSVFYGNRTGSINDVEKWDAFYLVDELTISNTVQNKSIELTRPVGQLNWATQDAFNPAEHQVKVTLSNVATTFNPLNNEVSNLQDLTFSFNEFTEETLTTGENAYTYLTCNYLFPNTLTATFDLQKKDGTSVKKVEGLGDIKIAMNMRTNVLGSIVQEPEAPAGWDGVTFTAPTNEDLTCNVTIEGATKILHIDTPEELAYCMKNGYEGYDAIHICDNIDMGGHDWNELPVKTDDSRSTYSIVPKSVPEGIVMVGTSGEGQAPFTISNAKISSTGLFGDVKNITVKNLKLKDIYVKASGNVGVLAGTVTGASTFENVIVEGGSVEAENGAAGGMVGYINHESVTNQAVTTTLLGCQANGITNITGGVMGKLVGEFSGYSYNEVLNFIECSSDITMEATSFNNVNKSCFIEQSLDENENDLLGRETYCRGTVNFGENRFVPKWDGVRSDITPLTENGVNVIYSPYDIAYFQGKSPDSVTFKTDVDLGSKKFNPIYSIKTLDGDNNTVYNLKVDMVHDGTGAAFIQTASGTTSHRNLIIRGADVKNVHNTSLYPAYGISNDGGAGNAYGGIFMSRAHGTYAIENIHVKESKLYAVCKMGGVIGSHTEGTLSMSNCSVDNCIIQNYKPNVPNYYVLGSSDAQPWMTLSSYYVNLLQWWYTNGEAGGLIGFLQSKEVNIDNCSVTNTAINCEGVANKEVIANVYKSSNFKTSDPFNSTSSRILAKGKTTIAGRHVNQFIGDVVSYRAEGGNDYVTNITNYTVFNNTYNGTTASSTNSYSHKYATNKYCEVVGCAYYIGLDINIFGIISLGHMKSCAGELKFSSLDGKTTGSFTEDVGQGSNIAWTGGDFSVTETNILNGKKYGEYPSEPARKDPVY